MVGAVAGSDDGEGRYADCVRGSLARDIWVLVEKLWPAVQRRKHHGKATARRCDFRRVLFAQRRDESLVSARAVTLRCAATVALGSRRAGGGHAELCAWLEHE